jgi:hypothetical protein
MFVRPWIKTQTNYQGIPSLYIFIYLFIYLLFFNMNLDLSYGQNLGQVGPINMR